LGINLLKKVVNTNTEMKFRW